MDNKRISGNEVSEQNKEALQSETWKEARKVIKTEIVHFTDMPECSDILLLYQMASFFARQNSGKVSNFIKLVLRSLD